MYQLHVSILILSEDINLDSQNMLSNPSFGALSNDSEIFCNLYLVSQLLGNIYFLNFKVKNFDFLKKG
jgi:hypothetical protein